MYTTAEILKKQSDAEAAGLAGAELLDDVERAVQICNGIGACWMPEWLRALISRMFPTLVLPADIHDLRYEQGGNELDRLLADVEMLGNGIRNANHKYRRFDPLRYITQFVMLQFYIKLREYGALAFNKQEDEKNA